MDWHRCRELAMAKACDVSVKPSLATCHALNQLLYSLS